VVIVAGVPSVSMERLAPATTWPSFPAILAAGMLIFVAYEGFELIANASDDMQRPARNLPLAFGLSVGLVVLLYVAISTVVVGSLTPAEIVQSADVALAKAAGASLGQLGFTLVAVSALLATLSATNATLYGAARLSFTLATEGELSPTFERKEWNQPIGLHITALVGLSLAVGLPLASISTVCSAIFLAVFTIVNGAAFKASKEIGSRRWLAGMGVLCCAASLIVLVVRSVSQDRVGLIVLAVLLVSAITAEFVVLRQLRQRDNP